MPSPGLSLVGFMDQAQAIEHLRLACLPANASDAALIAEWQGAQARLGAPSATAGKPDMKNIPAAHDAYIDRVMQGHNLALSFPGIQRDWFKLVEIDSLLAFQFTVNSTRSQEHCAGLKKTDIVDLLPVCLPDVVPQEQYHWQIQEQSLLIKSRSLNLRIFQKGVNQNVAGIVFGAALPLMIVAQLNGRYYLSNGYHRAYGARAAGATHIPCIVRGGIDATDIGIVPGGTFALPLLESNNPPTIGHLTQGRAHAVTLRHTSRIMHVSWAEYVVFDE